jgi:hypothetical protein
MRMMIAKDENDDLLAESHSKRKKKTKATPVTGRGCLWGHKM